MPSFPRPSLWALLLHSVGLDRDGEIKIGFKNQLPPTKKQCAGAGHGERSTSTRHRLQSLSRLLAEYRVCPSTTRIHLPISACYRLVAATLLSPRILVGGAAGPGTRGPVCRVGVLQRRGVLSTANTGLAPSPSLNLRSPQQLVDSAYVYHDPTKHASFESCISTHLRGVIRFAAKRDHTRSRRRPRVRLDILSLSVSLSLSLSLSLFSHSLSLSLVLSYSLSLTLSLSRTLTGTTTPDGRTGNRPRPCWTGSSPKASSSPISTSTRCALPRGRPCSAGVTPSTLATTTTTELTTRVSPWALSYCLPS